MKCSKFNSMIIHFTATTRNNQYLHRKPLDDNSLLNSGRLRLNSDISHHQRRTQRCSTTWQVTQQLSILNNFQMKKHENNHHIIIIFVDLSLYLLPTVTHNCIQSMKKIYLKYAHYSNNHYITSTIT